MCEMKKIACLLFLFAMPILFSVAAVAQIGAITGYCNLGASHAKTSGLQSSNYLQGIVPSCTVTVYLTGTTTLATIYADSSSTPLTNPFTATTAGQWLFFTSLSQGYDIVLSGGISPNTYTTSVTLTALYPFGNAVWGKITGTLSNQTDLQTALNAKLNLSGGTMTGDLTLPNLTATGTVTTVTSSVTGNQTVGGNQTVTGTSTTASTISPLVNKLYAQDYRDIANAPMFNWLKSVHAAEGQFVVLQVIGDSYSICDHTICSTGPTLSTNRWPEQLRMALQSIYGYGGTGMMPINFSITGLNVNTENYPSTTGTLDTALVAFGPNGGTTSTNSLVHMSTGSTITFKPGSNLAAPLPEQSPLPYDTLYVYCVTTPSSGTLSVSIDSGTAQALTNCNSTTTSDTVHIASVSASTLGIHTAVVTSTGNSYVYAMEGTAGTTGVIVSNLGYGGSDSNYWGSATASQLAFNLLEPGIHSGVIIMLQTNDIGHNVLPATTGTNIQNIVTYELADSASPSVMLAIPPVSGDTGTYPASQYTAQQMIVADNNNIGLDNIQWRWGTTFNSGSGLWSSDNVHPNDAGSLDEYYQIQMRLMDIIIPYSNNILGNFNLGTTGRLGSTADYASTNPWALSNQTKLNPGINYFSGSSGGNNYGSDLGFVTTNGGTSYNLFINRRFAPSGSLIGDCFYTGSNPPTLQSAFTCPLIISSTGLTAFQTLYLPAGIQFTNGVTQTHSSVMESSWEWPSSLFATSSTTSTHFSYFPGGGTIVSINAATVGTMSCATTPVISIGDCGTTTNSGSCASTTLTTYTIPSSSPGVNSSSALSVSIPAGHWIAAYFSSGTCTTAPTINASMTVEVQ
jgi:lysophospholipase L1-like esterase